MLVRLWHKGGAEWVRVYPSPPTCSGRAQERDVGMDPRQGQPDGASDCGMPHGEEGITWGRTHVPEVMGLHRKLIARVLESQGAGSARCFSSDAALTM